MSRSTALCWGLLYHMLGLAPEARAALDSVAESSDHDSGLKRVAQAVGEFLGLVQDSESAFKTRQECLVKIVDALGQVVDPTSCGRDWPDLSKECLRGSGLRQALDSPAEGYSRDPFKELTNLDQRQEVALAAILYLTRSHALFFAHPRALRGFNAAKVALNDLFQAGQLAARLYYSLDVSHLKKLSQHAYLGEVRRGPVPGQPGGPSAHVLDPPTSSYFIWWLLELVEIQRGNIYRQIEYLEQGKWHYRHAQERFERLAPSLVWAASDGIFDPKNPRNDRWFITPTLLLAISERAKIQFDLGHVVESIGNDLLCLALLVRRSLLLATQRQGTNATDLLGTVSRALEFLRVVQGQWVLDKEAITRLFKPGASVNDTTPLTPDLFEPFLNHLPRLEKKLAADLFARLGFAHFLLRRRRLLLRPWTNPEARDARQSEKGLAAWLNPYFTVGDRVGVPRPALASYCMSLLGTGSTPNGEVAFPDILERQLAQRLRQALPRTTCGGSPLNLAQLCSALLELTTQNIDNIVTIPRRMARFLMRMGYKERRTIGDVSASTVYHSLCRSLEQGNAAAPAAGRRTAPSDLGPRDKLVVLRRWQSFNPRIPRPVTGAVRGGGYFLLWRGKGIVIDPGYDFIQNFYEEGFSLEDIDAVVVTHSHPDHDDDLSTLTTLAREWDDLCQKRGRTEAVKLDLFLNESSHMKFAAWLKASQIGIGRIVPMPLVVWDAASKDSTQKIRGDCTVIDLRKAYHLRLEVVPAWHNDVIGRTASVGLKFHLFGAEDKRPGVVGYTGDTGAYGWPEPGGHAAPLLIEAMYGECDVLVANLGDVRLRELATRLGAPPNPGAVLLGSCLDQLLRDWFWKDDRPCMARVIPDRVGEFLGLIVDLHLATGTALSARIGHSPEVTVARVLGEFVTAGATGGFTPTADALDRELTNAAQEDWEYGHCWPAVLPSIRNHVAETVPTGSGWHLPLVPWQIAYALLGYLCAKAREGWRYEYHLGIEGIYRLHKAMRDAAEAEEAKEAPTGHKRTRIFVVSELPEELASYRHQVARLLNMAERNWSNGQRRVNAFTADIGLHIGLTNFKNKEWEPQIRCTYCNYNNETVLRGLNYHAPAKTLETSIKRFGAAMVYLCTEHDHHPENEDVPLDFLVAPNLRAL